MSSTSLRKLVVISATNTCSVDISRSAQPAARGRTQFGKNEAGGQLNSCCWKPASQLHLAHLHWQLSRLSGTSHERDINSNLLRARRAVALAQRISKARGRQMTMTFQMHASTVTDNNPVDMGHRDCSQCYAIPSQKIGMLRWYSIVHDFSRKESGIICFTRHRARSHLFCVFCKMLLSR